MKDLNKIILAGMFLAMSSLLVIIQIPIFSFLRLDFSLVPLLIVELYISFFYLFVIAILAPFMVLIVYGDFVGMLFLIVLNVVVITLHHFLYNKKNKKRIFLSSLFIIVLACIIVSLLNILIFVPLFYGFAYVNDFVSIWIYWIIVIAFNLIKLIIVYLGIGIYVIYFQKQNEALIN